ncbi:MAG: IS701 family transposase [Gammaproteobacteria bacterium]|nr:MAG: IS701 family transposase [Gammaproteobacteria bacterium]
MNLADQFIPFHAQYTKYFELKTRSVVQQSYQYLCGLMQANKKNIDRMVESVPETNSQSLQNFISHSPWDAFALMDQTSKDVNDLFGDDPDSCLIIDESAFTKKGSKSAGVSRQWSGRLGKVDNCQVGVFAALNCREKVSLINTRLFLPTSWTDSEVRCKKAGVPKERMKHKKKTELALEMIESARSNGLSHKWIGADAFYGEDPSFLRAIDNAGETFLVDVHCDQPIFLEDPKPYIPKRTSTKGRKPVRLKTDIQHTTVAQWAANQSDDAWQEIVLRDGSKGPLKVRAIHGRVWLWDRKEKHAHCWHLIVRHENGSKNKLKYSISNAHEKTSIERLAFMQGQRYFVERAIEDAKSSAGMADYQVRPWTGWHHHMAMVMLAMLFMLKTKIYYSDSYELLSCNDIRELLAHFLPQRAITKKQVIEQMKIRHKKRKYAMQHHKKPKINKSD